MAFLFSCNVHSVITQKPLENDNIVHRDEGRCQFFPPSVHSAQTIKGLENDKKLHSKRGHGRPFPRGFFVDLGWVRGGRVISLFFYYISGRSAGASSGRGSGPQRQRALQAARAGTCDGQNLFAAGDYGAPPGGLSSVAARSHHRCPCKRRWPVLWRLSLFPLLRAQCQVRSLMCVQSSFQSLRFGFRFSA